VRRTERTPALWIGDTVGGENIVAAHVLVVIADVAAEALTDAVEHRSIHHQAANITRKVVGRATEQTIRPRGNSTVSLEPSLQILARPRQQEIGREGFSILLERHEIAILGVALAVVDHGEGLRRIAERRMGGDIFDQLTPDIDAPTVADAAEIFLAGHQHCRPLSQLDDGERNAATAPPSSVMNSRRFIIRSPRRRAVRGLCSLLNTAIERAPMCYPRGRCRYGVGQVFLSLWYTA